MEIASCHPSSAWNFEVALVLFGGWNFCTPALLIGMLEIIVSR
jgi:hypothetical protein